MFLLLASVVTLAFAAPQKSPEVIFTYFTLTNYMRDVVPDASNMGNTIDHYSIAYDSTPWTILTTDNQCILTMPIADYKEEDIDVLAHTGVLIVRAIHKEDNIIKKSDLSTIMLPQPVIPSGWWTHHDGVIKVVFALKGKENDGTAREEGSSDVTVIAVDSLDGLFDDW